MRSRSALCFVFMMFLVSGSFAQDLRFSITPFLSFDSYRALGFDSGMNAGVSAQVRFTDLLAGGATIAFGDRDLPMDFVSGSRRLTAHFVSYSADVEFRIVGDSGAMGIFLTATGGGVTSSTEGTRLSLGAIGMLDVPPRSDSRGFIGGGAQALIPLSARIAVSLHPAVRFFTPWSNAVPDVTIAGGLRVGIF